MPRSLLTIVICLLLLYACRNTEGNKVAQDLPQAFQQPHVAAITEQILASPEDAALYYQRGVALEEMQEDSLALLDYVQATKLDSTQAKYFSAVGDLHFRHKNITGSLPWFKQAIAINPRDAKAHLNFAKVLIFAKDFPQAFKEINLVLCEDVYNPETYFLKGLIYKEMKDTAKAISSFQTALQVAPDYKDAMIQLGQIFRDKQDPIAFTYYENAFKTDTTDVFPLYAMGMIYQERKEFAQAKAVYARMILAQPQSADAYFNTGYILLQQDSVEKARRMFDRVTKIEPDNAGAYYNRGLCAEIMGDKKAAKDDYEQALTFDKQYKDAEEGVKRLSK